MAPAAPQSLYNVLEVGPTACADDIEAAYCRLRDLVSGQALAVYAMLDDAEVEALRGRLEEAYHILGDAGRRRAYDAHLNTLASPAVGAPGELAYPSLPRAAREAPEPQPPPATTHMGGPCVQGGARGVEAAVGSTAAPQGARHAYGAPTLPWGRHARGGLTRPRRATRSLRPTLSLDYSSPLEVNGELLRRLRKSAGAELDDISAITKINKRYLAALEADDCASLPANVYVRGFVTEYARALHLEAATVAKSYMDQYLRQHAQSGP